MFALFVILFVFFLGGLKHFLGKDIKNLIYICIPVNMVTVITLD